MVTSEDTMTYAIHFLSEEIKDVPISLCNSQIVAIGVVCTIFEKCRTIEAYPTVCPTTVPYPPKSVVLLINPPPVRYPAPISEGDHGKDRTATSKGVQKKQTAVTSKGGHVPVTYKGDQEPFDTCTISLDAPPPSSFPFVARHLHLDAPVSARTRSCTVLKNLTTPSRSRSLAAQIMLHAVFSVL